MRGDIYPWETLSEYDIDQLIIKHMSVIEKREWLEVNKPKQMNEFFFRENNGNILDAVSDALKNI